ncbi:MAG: hypothetical protein WDM86_13825 [Rhizomicrobium sp.]
MTIGKKLLAAAFALSLAAPLALTPAEAAPHGGGMMSGHPDAFHDHNRRPANRLEHRPPMPHGHYHWRAGAWNWRNGVWVWAPGIWIRF